MEDKMKIKYDPEMDKWYRFSCAVASLVVLVPMLAVCGAIEGGRWVVNALKPKKVAEQTQTRKSQELKK